ncbi:MAG TPA: TolC family protein [Terracidiphilus sp.]|nr:TolC family protein [Terracidiphilus sp.]
MNSFKVKAFMKISRISGITSIQSVLAILLLQASVAVAVQPPAPKQASGNPQATVPPEAPAPPASQPAAAPLPLAQEMQKEQQQPVTPPKPFYIPLPHSRNPLSPYMPNSAPPPDLNNSPLLQSLVRDGKLYLSLRDVIALAIENNLDLALFRYNFPIAQTDLKRTEAGAPAGGVNTAVAQSSTQGGFSSSSAGSGGASSNSAGAGAGGIVTTTLGAGAPVPQFDPYLTFNGYVDHTVTQEGNIFQVGVTPFKQNTIEGLANYSQSFRLGTNLTIDYVGQRFANNSPYEAINPTLYSNFRLQIAQPLLAGFGISSNERYIQIAKQNIKITDVAFRLQVITTVTQVENIYWDLVNAYEDEQVKERTLAFAQKTLQDDQEQFKLNAIPAMQVMKDESDVATSESNLTVARETLRLNELQMKDAITRSDDPTIDEVPVIPLDRVGPSDPNASKSIDELIAEAEKNRPDVIEDEMAMQKEQASLKDIRSELLPSLNLYGVYAGAGIAGPKNPNCNLRPDQCTSDLPTGFGSMLQNTFNYSSPEYRVGMTLSINLRNRIAKADQFRTALQFRQAQITFEEQKKKIRFDVRNSLYQLQQAKANVQSAQKALDLQQRTFDVAVKEQKLGATSSYDTLVAQNNLAIAQSAFAAAQTAYEKAKVDIDRATGETLEQTGVSIDDAKAGVVSHAP